MSFVLFLVLVEPLHLYVKETVPPVTTPSTTPSVPDTTVVLEGNSLKTLQLFVLEGNSPNKIILLYANYLFQYLPGRLITSAFEHWHIRSFFAGYNHVQNHETKKCRLLIREEVKLYDTPK